MLKPHAILASLAKRRPIFHSEADFQHALAWEIQKQCPSANVRLEKRVSVDKTRLHLDLIVQSSSDEFVLELNTKRGPLRLLTGRKNTNC